MKKLKSWPVWMLMGIVTVALLAVGTTRDSGPLTQSDRIDAISKRIACPTCDGESIFVSRATAADAIRKQVARDVAAGQLSDDEIIATIAQSFDAQVLLVPRATGLDSLVWVLPIAVLVCAIAGLVIAFRRWRAQLDADASDEDFVLVEKLLAEDPTDAENV
ncbi:MAG: cytochrome c biosis protein CcmH [Actinomycetota bacterium]